MDYGNLSFHQQPNMSSPPLGPFSPPQPESDLHGQHQDQQSHHQQDSQQSQQNHQQSQHDQQQQQGRESSPSKTTSSFTDQPPVPLPSSLTMSSLFPPDMGSPPTLGRNSALHDFLNLPRTKPIGSPSTPAYSAFTVESNAVDSPVSSSLPSVPQAPHPPAMPFLPTAFDNASVVSGFRDHRDFTPPPKTSQDARKYLLSILAEKSASEQNTALTNDSSLPSVTSPRIPHSAAFSPPPAPALPAQFSALSSIDRSLSAGKASNGSKQIDRTSPSASVSSTDAPQRDASRPSSDVRQSEGSKPQSRNQASDFRSDTVSESKGSNGDSNSSKPPIETFLFPLSPFCSITLANHSERPAPIRIGKSNIITEFAAPPPSYPASNLAPLAASRTSVAFVSGSSPTGTHVFSSRTGSEIILSDQTQPVSDVSVSWERDISRPFAEYVISTSADSTCVYFTQLQTSWPGSSICFQLPGNNGQPAKAKPSECHSDVFAVASGHLIRLVHPLKELGMGKFDTTQPIRLQLQMNRDCCIDAGDVIVDFAFSSDDTVLATFDASGALKFWDIRDPKSTNRAETILVDGMNSSHPSHPLRVYETITNDVYQPCSVLFLDLEKPFAEKNPHRYVLLGYQQNHLLQLWDLQLGKCVQELRLPFVAETDSLCRITYHQQSGFLCVFHPVRVSLFLLSLSFPQYRLLEKLPSGTLSRSTFDQLAQTQAGYFTLISSTKEARPPENTVIMKGATEASLEPLGNVRALSIRNMDIVKESNSSRRNDQEDGKDGHEKKSRRNKKKVEQHTLFELFVMHSQGIISFILKPEDIGYHVDLKPTHPVEPTNNTNLRLTSISKASSPSSMPRSQKIPPPALVDLTPLTRNVQPVSDPYYPKSSGGKSVGNGTKEAPTNSYQKPLSDDEEDPTYQSVLEEEDDPHFASDIPEAAPVLQFDTVRFESQLTAKFDLLSQSLINTHQGHLENSVAIIQQRSNHLEENLRQNVCQSVQSQLKSSSNGMDKAIRRATDDMQSEFKAVTASLVSDIRSSVDASLNSIRSTVLKMVSEQINAVANKAADRATAEVMKLLSEQQYMADRRRRQDEERLDKMMEMINNLALNSVRPPTADATIDGEAKSIRKLLRESLAEDAVLAWLGSTRQVELFDEIFVDLGPDFIRQLSPESALAVAAVVTTSLEGPTVMYRLKWIRSIISHLESALKKSRDPELLRIIPHVMSILTSRFTPAQARFQKSGDDALFDMISDVQDQIKDLARLHEGPVPIQPPVAAPPAPAPTAPNQWMSGYGGMSDTPSYAIGSK